MKSYFRTINAIAFLLCCALISSAFYLEYIQGLMPCPLCMLQRGILILIGLIFLVAVLHNPARISARLYAFLTGIFSVAGAALAGRQVWLQSQPADPNATCLPGLNYLLQTMLWQDVLKVAIKGSVECAQKDWTFLGFTLAAWTLIAFAVLALISILQVSRTTH